MRHYILRQQNPLVTQAIGATLGQDHLAPLVRSLRSDPDLTVGPGEIVVLDFSGLEAATSSYLKATILWLVEAGRLAAGGEQTPGEPRAPAPLNVFPVVTGLSAEIREELNDVLLSRSMPCLEASHYDDISIQQARLLGFLDVEKLSTLEILVREHETTAPRLHEKYASTGIGATGWNNRLTALHRLRLARRTKQGRQWVYSSLAKEVMRG